MTRHWEAEGKRQRQRRYAELILPAAMGLAAAAAGREALDAFVIEGARAVYPRPSERSAALDDLARRIRLLCLMLPQIEPDGEGINMFDAVLEIAAIARGDEPRLFAKIELGPNSRRRANAFRLALHQAHALMWDAFFRGEGLEPKEAHLLVSSAFGEDYTTWTRWRDPVQREIGDLHWNVLMGKAKNFRSQLAQDLDEAKVKVRRDGERYRAEKRRQQ